ncbi:MAG: hypothetical protein RIQ79_69, partial [Verrucomicrobiota bacterium]
MPKSLTKPSITQLRLSPSLTSTSIDRTIGLHATYMTPRFDEFARQHPFVGAKIGGAQWTTNGTWVQEFQNATAYGTSGALASEIHEVHGAIRDRYRSFGGPDGFLGLPIT